MTTSMPPSRRSKASWFVGLAIVVILIVAGGVVAALQISHDDRSRREALAADSEPPSQVDASTTTAEATASTSTTAAAGSSKWSVTYKDSMGFGYRFSIALDEISSSPSNPGYAIPSLPYIKVTNLAGDRVAPLQDRAVDVSLLVILLVPAKPSVCPDKVVTTASGSACSVTFAVPRQSIPELLEAAGTEKLTTYRVDPVTEELVDLLKQQPAGMRVALVSSKSNFLGDGSFVLTPAMEAQDQTLNWCESGTKLLAYTDAEGSPKPVLSERPIGPAIDCEASGYPPAKGAGGAYEVTIEDASIDGPTWNHDGGELRLSIGDRVDIHNDTDRACDVAWTSSNGRVLVHVPAHGVGQHVVDQADADAVSEPDHDGHWDCLDSFGYGLYVVID